LTDAADPPKHARQSTGESGPLAKRGSSPSMSPETFLSALLLGLVEGITEFVPVSSTAHILLIGHFLGFESTGKTFEVLIQLGAILAIVSVYFGKLLQIVATLPTSRETQRFVLGVLVAFLPAMVLGALLHNVIKTVFFETPALYCTTLILGGLALLWIDRLPLKPRHLSAWEFPAGLCFRIGLCQCLALVPGVSRSGATIAGALLMGADKRSAAEFSFFLAMPTMAGAFAYDLYKNRDVLSLADAWVIAAGFAAAFVAAVLVVRSLLGFVSRHGFAPFAYWRLLVGAAGLAGLMAVR
jgi:undecaprenyl-diphosphatase